MCTEFALARVSHGYILTGNMNKHTPFNNVTWLTLGRTKILLYQDEHGRAGFSPLTKWRCVA